MIKGKRVPIEEVKKIHPEWFVISNPRPLKPIPKTLDDFSPKEKDMLTTVAALILAIDSDAYVFLGGSRVKGLWKEDSEVPKGGKKSDWDIIILTASPEARKKIGNGKSNIIKEKTGWEVDVSYSYPSNYRGVLINE